MEIRLLGSWNFSTPNGYKRTFIGNIALSTYVHIQCTFNRKYSTLHISTVHWIHNLYVSTKFVEYFAKVQINIG